MVSHRQRLAVIAALAGTAIGVTLLLTPSEESNDAARLAHGARTAPDPSMPPALDGAARAAQRNRSSAAAVGDDHEDDRLRGMVVVRSDSPISSELAENGELILAPAEFVDVEVSDSGEHVLRSRVYNLGVAASIDPTLGLPDAQRIRVRGGVWSCSVPRNDLVAVSFVTDERAWDIVSGAAIAADSRTARVVIELSQGVRLEVVDATSGERIPRADAFASISPPRNRPVFVVAGAGGSSGPSKDAPRNSWAGAPPARARSIALGAATPLRLPSSPLERTLWVGADGYQWERVWIPVTAEEVSVALRAIGSLRVSVQATSWSPKALSVNVMRSGRSIARHRLSGRVEDFEVHGVGAGEYRVFLDYELGTTSGVLDDASILVLAGEESTVELSAGDRSTTLDARIELHIQGLEASEAAQRNLGLRLSRRDRGRSGLRSATFVPVTAMGTTDGGVTFLTVDVEPGEYLVRLSPGGFTYRLTAEPGVTTHSSLTLPPTSHVNLYWERGPDDGPGLPNASLVWRVEEAASGTTVDDELSGGTTPIIPRTTDGAPSASMFTWAGTFDFLAVDGRTGEVVAAAMDVEVLEGPNDVSLRRLPAEATMVEVFIQGQSSDRSYSVLGGRSLELVCERSVRARPFSVTSRPSGDLGRTVCARFLVRRSDVSVHRAPKVLVGGEALEVVSVSKAATGSALVIVGQLEGDD